MSLNKSFNFSIFSIIAWIPACAGMTAKEGGIAYDVRLNCVCNRPIHIKKFLSFNLRMLPKNRAPTHLGKMLLKEFLEPHQITQTAFAKHLNWSYARLNEIISGRRGISADSALAFADAFKMEPEFWLNLQRDWELWHAKQEHHPIKPKKLDEAA